MNKIIDKIKIILSAIYEEFEDELIIIGYLLLFFLGFIALYALIYLPPEEIVSSILLLILFALGFFIVGFYVYRIVLLVINILKKLKE